MSFLIENKIQTLHYFLVWLFYVFIQAICLQWMLDVSFWVLLVDSFVHGLMYAFFGMVLWNIMAFGNYENMLPFQRIINYTALAVLILIVWVGLGYGLDYVFFGKEIAHAFIPVLPLYVFIGGMLYLILLFYFRTRVIMIEEEEESRFSGSLIKPNGSETENSAELKEAEGTEELERIAVKSGHKIHVILVADIFYLQADGDYVHIFTKDGKYMKEQTMKFFDENLPAAQFVRVHRSFIVNIEAISRIEQYEKQNQLLTLKNGHHIKVSIAGYKLLKNKLGL